MTASQLECKLHSTAGGWFSIMMALIFGGIMLLWFWGSSHKNAFFATHFNAHIKKLEDLLAVVDAPDLSAPPKLRLVAENKPVGQTPVVVPTVVSTSLLQLRAVSVLAHMQRHIHGCNGTGLDKDVTITTTLSQLCTRT